MKFILAPSGTLPQKMIISEEIENGGPLSEKNLAWKKMEKKMEKIIYKKNQ